MRGLEDEWRSSQQELESLKNKYKKVLAENDKLGQDNEKLGEDVRTLQEDSFKNQADARWVALDTKSIRGEVDSIREAIWLLAKSHAAESLAGLADQDEESLSAFRDSLKDVVSFSKDDPKAVLELTTIKHAARLLLAALISHSVHIYVLTSPFFFLNDGLDGEFAMLKQGGKREILKQRPNAPGLLTRIFQDAWKCQSSCDFLFMTVLTRSRRSHRGQQVAFRNNASHESKPSRYQFC